MPKELWPFGGIIFRVHNCIFPQAQQAEELRLLAWNFNNEQKGSSVSFQVCMNYSGRYERDLSTGGKYQGRSIAYCSDARTVFKTELYGQK